MFSLPAKNGEGRFREGCGRYGFDLLLQMPSGRRKYGRGINQKAVF